MLYLSAGSLVVSVQAQGDHRRLEVLRWSVLVIQKINSALTPALAWFMDETMCRNVIHLSVPTQTGERVCKIHPRTNQDSSSWEWYALIAQRYQNA